MFRELVQIIAGPEPRPGDGINYEKSGLPFLPMGLPQPSSLPGRTRANTETSEPHRFDSTPLDSPTTRLPPFITKPFFFHSFQLISRLRRADQFRLDKSLKSRQPKISLVLRDLNLKYIRHLTTPKLLKYYSIQQKSRRQLHFPAQIHPPPLPLASLVIVKIFSTTCCIC